MNKVFLVGNLGKDPATGTTKNGNLWANASLATQKKVKDEFVTTWHYVVAWQKTAELLASCKKGDTIFVEGELKNNKYTNKKGEEVTATQVQANLIVKSQPKSAGQELFGPDGDDMEP